MRSPTACRRLPLQLGFHAPRMLLRGWIRRRHRGSRRAPSGARQAGFESHDAGVSAGRAQRRSRLRQPLGEAEQREARPRRSGDGEDRRSSAPLRRRASPLTTWRQPRPGGDMRAGSGDWPTLTVSGSFERTGTRWRAGAWCPSQSVVTCRAWMFRPHGRG